MVEATGTVRRAHARRLPTVLHTLTSPRDRGASPSVRVPDDTLTSLRAGDCPLEIRGAELASPSPGRGRGPRPDEVPLWALLVPEGTVSLDARRQSTAACVRRIAGLPPQSWVSVVDDRPLSWLRLRVLARRCGLVVERELVAVPTVDAATALAEHGGRHGLPHSGTTIVRVLPWTWSRWLIRDRVLLARRP